MKKLEPGVKKQHWNEYARNYGKKTYRRYSIIFRLDTEQDIIQYLDANGKTLKIKSILKDYINEHK